MTLVVVAAPPAALIQDLGRPGHRALGIAPSGAVDQSALRVANRLVGNAEGTAGIEVTLGGLVLRATAPTVVCATGAEAPLHIGGRARDLWRAHAVAAGEEISLGLASRGARVYLGVRGGIALDKGHAVLGSFATDTMSGLGAPRLAAGTVLRTGVGGPIPVNDIAPWRVIGDDVTLRVRRGPRADWFSPAAWRTLTSSTWTVSVDADRIGVRLDGPPLERVHSRELPSEGMVVGALQVPPSGHPVILLADGPVTGGYPVIGVIASTDRDALGQLRPGTRVHLRP